MLLKETSFATSNNEPLTNGSRQPLRANVARSTALSTPVIFRHQNARKQIYNPLSEITVERTAQDREINRYRVVFSLMSRAFLYFGDKTTKFNTQRTSFPGFFYWIENDFGWTKNLMDDFVVQNYLGWVHEQPSENFTIQSQILWFEVLNSGLLGKCCGESDQVNVHY